MALHFGKSFRLFAETASFVIARLIPTLYFAFFSVIIALFFILLPGYLGLNYPIDIGFLIFGVGVFLTYWSFFRKRLLYALKASETVAVSEFIFGRNIPITMQASYGFNLIKKKFSSIKNFQLFEKNTRKVIRVIYGKLGFIGFIPNVDSAVVSAVFSYVFSDPSVDPNTSLRDGLILFDQKKTFLLFQIFAVQIFAYVLFMLCYLVLFFIFNPFIMFFSYPLNLLGFILLFLLLLVFYSSFVSHFLVCWQSVFFLESVKHDVSSKAARSVLENKSLEFNEISSRAKVFVPLKSISERNLLYSFEKASAKKNSVLSSLDGIIQDKEELEKESKGEEALSNLVSKINEIKSEPKRKELTKKLLEEKKILAEKYRKEKEYNTVFNLLLEYLGTELGTKHVFQVTSLEKKGNAWNAIVLIDSNAFNFTLDSK
ncbi:hypothetical protein KKB11_01850, partial [Candidatus Micrarchaeota archaeon]|nr:hypothetical protein [Candidatus Micrarchaeota archaeon]